MRSFDHRLPETITEAELMGLVRELNADPSVHGILVQLPLPPHIDALEVVAALAPGQGRGRLQPGQCRAARDRAAGLCALHAAGLHPAGQERAASLEGLEAVVIGRSNIVGKPLAQLLLAQNATVTIAHSQDPRICRRCAARADLLFAAVGQAEMVQARLRASRARP